MNGWDVAIWVVAAYVATLSLVRLMTARRKSLLDDLREGATAAKASQSSGQEAPSEAAHP
ncbi:MAG TPA: hypothetical protein VHC22_26845 [Pirellulales bacterium]|nr:hypothetical protein [Pirellulales bacterium]